MLHLMMQPWNQRLHLLSAVCVMAVVFALVPNTARARIFLDERPAAIAQMRAGTEIHVVYAGAGDCPPCWDWKRNYLPKWEADPASHVVTLRRVELPQVRDMKWRKKWPAELEHVRQQIIRHGAPQFVVLVDGGIVFHAWSTDTWRDDVVPFLKKAVLRKTSWGLIAKHGSDPVAVAESRSQEFQPPATPNALPPGAASLRGQPETS